MRTRCPSVLAIAFFGFVAFLATIPAQAVSNRIFMSTNGNNANDCANPLTPCLTFAGALAQVNLGGEVIAEATGGYGPLSITQAVTISGPPGVVIYSGLAVTVNAPGATVVLRGLTIDGTGAVSNGIDIQAIGTISIENCVINAFGLSGVHMGVPGNLLVKGTDIKGCFIGVDIDSSTGPVNASIDHCHFDSNAGGFRADTTSPGSSTTTATYSTANNNSQYGWIAGALSNGIDLVNLEFCSGSENVDDGAVARSSNASSVLRYSNCVFANNGNVGVDRLLTGDVQSRVNNTLTGNGNGPTNGSINQYLPQ